MLSLLSWSVWPLYVGRPVPRKRFVIQHCDTELEKSFLNMILKAWSIKEEIGKLEYRNINIFCSLETLTGSSYSQASLGLQGPGWWEEIHGPSRHFVVLGRCVPSWWANMWWRKWRESKAEWVMCCGKKQNGWNEGSEDQAGVGGLLATWSYGDIQEPGFCQGPCLTLRMNCMQFRK